MLGCTVIFFLLHFLHLRADFPNDSPWLDWSKYTDEGWYGDAAIRHFQLGHWNVPGDFNPGIALPVWPLLLAVVFRFTGVSLIAARVLAVCVFGGILVSTYALVERFPLRPERRPFGSLAAPLTVFLLALSPFFFVFDRMAILEPLLTLLTVVALLVASSIPPPAPRSTPWRLRVPALWPSLALGLLLPTMVLTKTPAVSLIPAVGAMLWYRSGYRLRPALRMALLPTTVAVAIWGAYMVFAVRPHYLEDYRYLFSANGYTGFQLQPLATVLLDTIRDGQWMGAVLYSTFFVGLVAAAFVRPAFFRNPLVAALLLWLLGYYAFLAYHYNLQPRYYLVPGLPITALVALLLDEFRLPANPGAGSASRAARGLLLTALVAAIALPDASQQIRYLRHPEYTFLRAAQAIAAIVRSTPGQSPLILSISGSDISLMTGLPSIDDDFGTLDLDQRVRQYRPGWYVAWNQIEDDKMDALAPLYNPVRVASFAAMDDPERNQLILYRLDPAHAAPRKPRHSSRTPRPLRTKLGQQPTLTQLQH